MVTNIYLYKITSFLCFLSFVIPLVHRDSDIITPLLLLTCALLFNRSLFHNNKDLAKINLVLFIYFFVALIHYLFFGGDLNQIDIPSRTAFFILILAFLVKYPPKTKYIMYGIPLGCLVTGFIAAYQYINIYSGVGVFRAFTSQGHMVIQAGGVCASLGTLSIISFFYACSSKDNKLKALAFSGALCALLTCLLTGARGAWLITPFIILWILWQQRLLLNKHLAILGAIVFLVCVYIAAPQISSRINAVYTDINRYNQEDTNSSSGIRLELWKSSYYSFLEKPLLGHGFREKIIEAQQRQIDRGVVSPVILGIVRAHNQFFEDLQNKGLIGLIALCALFWAPFSLFKKYKLKARATNDDYYISLMGQCHILLVIGYCLTHHFISLHSGMLFYLTGTVIFASICLAKSKQEQ